MLTRLRADLHVHTCLSPCGEDEMRPAAIVRCAKQRGLDVIAICDHNSTRNVAAVRRAAEGQGLVVMGGVEVSSAEEVHVLGLFDDAEGLNAMQKLIDDSLSGENAPDLFGEQCLCDENDVIVGRESRLLIGATSLSVEKVVAGIRSVGGLAIASHVDREGFSLLGQLGLVPEGLALDALEVSSRRSIEEALRSFPQIEGYPLVRSSDAHRLSEVGAAATTFAVVSPCVRELRKALRNEAGRAAFN